MTTSWAAIAKSEPVKVAQKEEDVEEKPRIAVVDANAIISGESLLQLMRFNDKVVTIPEVLKEIRDKQSRQTLQNLPFTIQTQEPAEESVKAVLRFARATGDVHALSSVDVRLLALAHTLEVQYYGSAHLRTSPPAPKVAKKKARDSKHLPGWGVEGGEWAEMDRLNEEELAAAEAALMAGQTSRIAAAVQQLTLGDGASDGSSLHITLDQQQHPAAPAAAASAAAPPAQAAPASLAGEAAAQGGSSAPQEAKGGPAGAPAGADVAALGSSSESEGESDSEEDDEEEEDGGWVTAARTKNVQRRQKRREIRRSERQAEAEAEAAAAAAAAAAAEQEGSDEEDYTSSSEDESSDEEGGEEGVAHADADADEAGSVAPVPASSVCSVTADFAMQNVLLQMGLRLVTPDGRRVSTLSRWVLRCTACYGVTKEMGRLFCPRCGNASLDKVRVVVGPDGAEQYGVRKKHILRGTKFSLPKPKGGRANDVILREDQLLAKMHRMRKKKSAAEELDPFAPEYNDETWCNQAAAVPGGSKSAAVLLAGWKHNPNERKHVATNRRRK